MYLIADVDLGSKWLKLNFNRTFKMYSSFVIAFEFLFQLFAVDRPDIMRDPLRQESIEKYCYHF